MKTNRHRRCGMLLWAFVLLPGIAASAGTITTVAGTGRGELDRFEGPADRVNINQTFGVELAPDGGLYICEVGHHRVLRLDLKRRTVTTVAGTGKQGYAGDGGRATEARLNEPYEVRFDRAGNMYVVEMVGAVVRKVDAKSGLISTVAGTSKPGFGGDGGPAVQAQLRSPHSIALDDHGGLYIADIGNHRIRRVDLETGVIETVAGNGERTLPVDDTVATGRPMLGPRALHVVGETMWIALREGHSVWRMDLKTRRLRHVAGTGAKGFHDGPAAEATFNGPKGIVAGPHDDIFVVDTENQVIRRIDVKAGEVSTVAGVGPNGRGYGGDGGPARQAKMDRPHGITVDAHGGLYIGDTNNHRVRYVRPPPALPLGRVKGVRKNIVLTKKSS